MVRVSWCPVKTARRQTGLEVSVFKGAYLSRVNSGGNLGLQHVIARRCGRCSVCVLTNLSLHFKISKEPEFKNTCSDVEGNTELLIRDENRSHNQLIKIMRVSE